MPCKRLRDAEGDHKLFPAGEAYRLSPSGDSATPLGDNILSPFTQNSLDLSPLLRYNYIEIFI